MISQCVLLHCLHRGRSRSSRRLPRQGLTLLLALATPVGVVRSGEWRSRSSGRRWRSSEMGAQSRTRCSGQSSSRVGARCSGRSSAKEEQEQHGPSGRSNGSGPRRRRTRSSARQAEGAMEGDRHEICWPGWSVGPGLWRMDGMDARVLSFLLF